MTKVKRNTKNSELQMAVNEQVLIYPEVSETGSWKTDYAWISGVIGAITVLVLAYVFNRNNIIDTGINIAGMQITNNPLDTKLAALMITALVMLAIELTRLWLWDKKSFFSIHPSIKANNYADFISDCLLNYFLHLGVLAVAYVFYHSAGEYGFIRNAPYYQPWFRFFTFVWNAYLWAGLPYVLLTRAIKYDATADKRDFASLLKKILMKAGAKVLQIPKVSFDEFDKKSARALIVKAFFTPLMTVFFVDQFQHLVSNMGYILDSLPQAIASGSYNINLFNTDVFNISLAFIFSIDVALAWCGYVISSRWVDNQTASAEPTMLGWVVCLMCYPPFQTYLGLYYSPPSERMILQLQEQWLVAIFTVMMTLSYLVYMSATLWFGVRFSNLTNRGIIRKGPFAIIRHPAYASKNFAWWCVMFPAIVLNLLHNGDWRTALMQTAGLIFMSWFYYLRAITEERHLRADPAYLTYCKQVRYRFIPGVI